MRPARKGPENPTAVPLRCTAFRGVASFNEAGPQGAGKRGGAAAGGPPPRSFNEAGPQGAGKLASTRTEPETTTVLQ